MSDSNGLVVQKWEVPASLSWEDWQSRMRDAAILQKKWAWYLGDLLNYGIENYGEKAWQLIGDIKLAHETLMNYKSIAGKILPEERIADVPFTVYQDIAALPREKRDEIVTAYQAGKLNRAEIRALRAQTNNGHENGAGNGLGTLPTAKELAWESFGLAMAVCAKLMKYGDEDNLKEALDTVVEKAMALKERL